MPLAECLKESRMRENRTSGSMRGRAARLACPLSTLQWLSHVYGSGFTLQRNLKTIFK